MSLASLSSTDSALFWVCDTFLSVILLTVLLSAGTVELTGCKDSIVFHISTLNILRDLHDFIFFVFLASLQIDHFHFSANINVWVSSKPNAAKKRTIVLLIMLFAFQTICCLLFLGSVIQLLTTHSGWIRFEYKKLLQLKAIYQPSSDLFILSKNCISKVFNSIQVKNLNSFVLFS